MLHSKVFAIFHLLTFFVIMIALSIVCRGIERSAYHKFTTTMSVTLDFHTYCFVTSFSIACDIIINYKFCTLIKALSAQSALCPLCPFLCPLCPMCSVSPLAHPPSSGACYCGWYPFSRVLSMYFLFFSGWSDKFSGVSVYFPSACPLVVKPQNPNLSRQNTKQDFQICKFNGIY